MSGRGSTRVDDDAAELVREGIAAAQVFPHAAKGEPSVSWTLGGRRTLGRCEEEISGAVAGDEGGSSRRGRWDGDGVRGGVATALVVVGGSVVQVLGESGERSELGWEGGYGVSESRDGVGRHVEGGGEGESVVVLERSPLLPVVAESLELNAEDGREGFDAETLLRPTPLSALLAEIRILSLQNLAFHELPQRLFQSSRVQREIHRVEGLFLLVPEQIPTFR